MVRYQESAERSASGIALVRAMILVVLAVLAIKVVLPAVLVLAGASFP